MSTPLRSTAPLVVAVEGGKGLDEWLEAHPHWDEGLIRHGVIIFRNAGVEDVDRFDRAVSRLVVPSDEFDEETSPRTALSERAFTSTEYPAAYPIQFHNEFSYRQARPEILVFACLEVPESGGSTPVADGRAMLEALPPEIVERFEDGVRYSRNFVGLGVPWEKAFGTQSREDVERYCDTHGVQAEWSEHGLHTLQRRSAIAVHPVSGERSWCNHILNFNVRGVEPPAVRKALLTTASARRPTDSFHADGTEIAAEVIETIRAAYESVAYRHPWRRGDLMVVDNILAAHARDAFTGTRRVVVGMGSRGKQ
ncbi:TauD/TfdA family dioxygenase [Nonomuraea sp. NPDC049152]|uniref:TauD/TfdA family dioxygenase n=1 Tax=Nonomuraea sp. NPDC049152 TaxID=3154350 RepID=UPI00340BF30F